MTEPPRDPPTPTDPAGGDGAWGPSPWYLAIGAGLVAGALAWWWTSTAPSTSDADAGGTAPPPALVSAAASGPPAATLVRVAAAASGAAPVAPAMPATTLPAAPSAPRIPRLRNPNGDQTPDLADYVNDGEKPTMAEVIDRLHQAGVHTGLGAFNPPGTRPPLIGLAVPEGFVLPAGYVRHYQATDDGQRIEAILMFAPDYQLVDAAQQPVAMPKDRVVPPELAPPGLPIRRIVVPAPIDSSRPGG
jgi:hypothetical protein